MQSCQVKGPTPTNEDAHILLPKDVWLRFVGMSDSDIFPNTSGMTLPGETLQEYTSSSISLRAPMSLSICDGVCDYRIGNGAALKVVNGGNRSRIRKPLGKNYPVKVRYDFR